MVLMLGVRSFVLPMKTNEQERVGLESSSHGGRGVMESVGSDRFHGEGLRGLRVTDPNLPTRTHRPYRTHKNPT